MAERRHKGIAITMAMPVTHKVLTIKTRNPNFPELGAQRDEKKRSVIEDFPRMGRDFTISPVPMENKIMIVRIVKKNIIFLPNLSFKIRLF